MTNATGGDDPRFRAMSRYRKLLALARDQSGAAEGTTALKLAQDLATRWGFSAGEVAEAMYVEALRPPATLTLHLGGDDDNHHREEFLPALLALLAEVAGTFASYDARRWEGYVYGDLETAQRVETVYGVAAPYFMREFKRFWVPRRFGARARRAVVAQGWWLVLLRRLRTWFDDLRDDGADDTTTLILRTRGETGPMENQVRTRIDAEIVRVLGYRLPPDVTAALLGLRRAG